MSGSEQSELFDASAQQTMDRDSNLPPGDQSEVERWALRSGRRYIIGVDEAGRGPLAGPVYVGCVALDLKTLPDWIDRVADSKTLSEPNRESAFDLIRRTAGVWSIQSGSPAEIDDVNILHATRRTMARAVESVCTSMDAAPDAVYVDGDTTIDINYSQNTVVDGDARSLAIAAASILAKVARDRFMVEQHQRWPIYGFDSHKGYATPQHLEALQTHGPSPLHRHSFAPVREAAKHH